MSGVNEHQEIRWPQSLAKRLCSCFTS